MRRFFTLWSTLVILALAAVFMIGAGTRTDDVSVRPGERAWLKNERSGATMQLGKAYTSGVSLLGVLEFGSPPPDAPPQWVFAAGTGTLTLSGSTVHNGSAASTTTAGSGVTFELRYATAMQPRSVEDWETLAKQTSGSTNSGIWDASSATTPIGKEFTPDTAPSIAIFGVNGGVSQFLAPEIPVYVR